MMPSRRAPSPRALPDNLKPVTSSCCDAKITFDAESRDNAPPRRVCPANCQAQDISMYRFAVWKTIAPHKHRGQDEPMVNVEPTAGCVTMTLKAAEPRQGDSVA
jgi:hypothetical protein